MNDFGLKGTQGHFAFAGKKGHKPTASTADSPDGPLLERPQVAKSRAVSFHQFAVRIDWDRKFRGGDDLGLLQVTEKTIERGLRRGRRRESEREFREKRFHGLGESRGIQAVVFSQILSEAKQAISILAQGPRRVTLLGQVAQITDEVLLERGARQSLRGSGKRR
ncbi:MAG: hypothetical protein ACHQ50_12700 [Fimbriimonadales bacterium]